MRHRKKTVKLGRTSSHRDALLSGMVCSLIRARRITTTISKAKAAKSLAERMVSLAKTGSLTARRRAISVLRQPEVVGILFEKIAPAFANRSSGYTRVLRLGKRCGDNSELAILEWVDYVPQPRKKKAEKKETLQ